MDVDTRRQLAVERAASLARAASHDASDRRRRQQLGFWLVEVGFRLACGRPVPSQA